MTDSKSIILGKSMRKAGYELSWMGFTALIIMGTIAEPLFGAAILIGGITMNLLGQKLYPFDMEG